MSKKRKARAQPIEKPRQGVYAEELVDAAQGHAKRLRRIDAYPLMEAKVRGRLGWPGSHPATYRFDAGDRFRDHYRKQERSGRDSTDMGIGGGGSRTPWTQEQANAMQYITRIKRVLKLKDYTIIEKFCGEDWSMADAVKHANIHVPYGVTARVCEALDELVDAVLATKSGSIAA